MRIPISLGTIKFLKRRRSYSIWILVVSLCSETVLTAWLIYGNILFYETSDDDRTSCANNASFSYYSFSIVLVVGYMYMFKCVLMGLAIVIGVPVMMYM